MYPGFTLRSCTCPRAIRSCRIIEFHWIRSVAADRIDDCVRELLLRNSSDPRLLSMERPWKDKPDHLEDGSADGRSISYDPDVTSSRIKRTIYVARFKPILFIFPKWGILFLIFLRVRWERSRRNIKGFWEISFSCNLHEISHCYDFWERNTGMYSFLG